ILALVPFILLSFLYVFDEVNSFISRPLISEGIYAAITPAATVLPVVSRNWRRVGLADPNDESLFGIDLLSLRRKLRLSCANKPRCEPSEHKLWSQNN